MVNSRLEKITDIIQCGVHYLYSSAVFGFGGGGDLYN